MRKTRLWIAAVATAALFVGSGAGSVGCCAHPTLGSLRIPDQNDYQALRPYPIGADTYYLPRGFDQPITSAQVGETLLTPEEVEELMYDQDRLRAVDAAVRVQ